MRITYSSYLLLALSLLFSLPLVAQEPDINEFIFCDSEPIPLNSDEIRAKIGYPEAAVEDEAQGTVVARILVGADGAYIKHKIVKQVHPALVEAVEARLPELLFTPAKRGEESIPFWINLPFPFRLLQQEQVIQEQIDELSVEINENGKDFKLWHRRGIQYTELEQYDQAVADFTQSIAINPRLNKKKAKKNTYEYLFYAYYGRAVARSGQERFEEAILDFDEAIQVAETMAIPDSSVQATLSNVYLERGFTKFQYEKYPEAEADYRRVLEMVDSSEVCGIRTLLLEVGLALDDYPLLVESYEALIGCDDNATDIYRYSLAYYRRKSGDPLRAIDDFQALLANTKNQSLELAGRNYLALSQLESGQLAEAEASLAEAMQVNALNPLSYFVKAKIQQKKGLDQEACPEFRRALIYGLAGEEAETAKQQLLEVCGEEYEED